MSLEWSELLNGLARIRDDVYGSHSNVVRTEAVVALAAQCAGDDSRMRTLLDSPVTTSCATRISILVVGINKTGRQTSQVAYHTFSLCNVHNYVFGEKSKVGFLLGTDAKEVLKLQA